MGLAEKLDELGAELNAFAFQPRTLVSDLVLFALATDVFESVKAVHHTSESTLPHKAYSNARLAFEGAQQALVLARTKTTRLRARGNIEFGYRQSPNRRHLEQGPAEQAALAEIRNLRRQGHTLRGTAMTLRSRGRRARRGTGWRLESVARVVDRIKGVTKTAG